MTNKYTTTARLLQDTILEPGVSTAVMVEYDSLYHGPNISLILTPTPAFATHFPDIATHDQTLHQARNKHGILLLTNKGNRPIGLHTGLPMADVAATRHSGASSSVLYDQDPVELLASADAQETPATKGLDGDDVTDTRGSAEVSEAEANRMGLTWDGMDGGQFEFQFKSLDDLKGIPLEKGMSIARASAQEQAMSASTEDDEVEPPVTDPVLPEEIIVKPPDCPAAESDSSVAELGPLAVRLHPDTRETEYQLVRSRQGGRGGPRTSWVRAADKGLSNDEIRRIRAYHAQRWELSPADLRLLASVDVMDLFALFDVPMMNELACCA